MHNHYPAKNLLKALCPMLSDSNADLLIKCIELISRTEELNALANDLLKEGRLQASKYVFMRTAIRNSELKQYLSTLEDAHAAAQKR